MESLTTIHKMISGNKIMVPDYQRAYSWDTSLKESAPKQVNVFLRDLEDYLDSSEVHSSKRPPYYFGHFLFEQLEGDNYAIIDGQQRLTTITIFLCALFRRLVEFRELEEEEQIIYENMIRRRSSYKFSTVKYDNQLFRDYVIDSVKKDHYGIDTTSARRFVEAYDFFSSKLGDINDVNHLERLLHVVVNSACTTHVVSGEAEAIQMFIFQNNRGKKPSHLEVIKAQFMYNIYIYCEEDADDIINEVRGRFELIYKYISKVEYFVDEDSVLSHTLKIFFNSLWEDEPLERISSELEKDTRIDFIRKFSLSLENSFDKISRLADDRKTDVNIEASLMCGNYDIILPFYIKAYSNGISSSDISRLAKALGDFALRDAIVHTKADFRSRIDNQFKNFTSSVDIVINRIEELKRATDYWSSFWSNKAITPIIEGNWNANTHRLAKVILWKYENYLIAEDGKAGYSPIRYDSIENPHLEHIAPQTENEEKEAAGYDTYDEEFRQEYLLCLGNFLLLSAPHNESIGNKPFEVKRNSYNNLRQQLEIQTMTEQDHVWDRTKIKERKNKIISFILENL